jgi:hypothetical protein
MAVLSCAKPPGPVDNPPTKEQQKPSRLYVDYTQPGLFGEFPFSQLGRLNQDEEIRKALVEDIHDYCHRHPGHSRTHVVELLQDLTGEPISEDILNAYTALSRRNYQFPARKVAAWCVAMNSTRLLDLILKPLGRRLATIEEEKMSEIGRIDSQIAKLQARKKDLL